MRGHHIIHTDRVTDTDYDHSKLLGVPATLEKIIITVPNGTARVSAYVGDLTLIEDYELTAGTHIFDSARIKELARTEPALEIDGIDEYFDETAPINVRTGGGEFRYALVFSE